VTTNESHELRLARRARARLRSITVALKIVGQRDKSRHASGPADGGEGGDHRVRARVVSLQGGTACIHRHARTHSVRRVDSKSSLSVKSSRNQSRVGTRVCTLERHAKQQQQRHKKRKKMTSLRLMAGSSVRRARARARTWALLVVESSSSSSSSMLPRGCYYEIEIPSAAECRATSSRMQ